jgi:P27 family predicted phage terminase small subunit
MKGRKPHPTRLKVLRGNPGKRALNAAEPMPARGIPDCPEWLDDVAKAKWDALVPELDRLGLLTVVDGDVLACYCQAWAEFQEATEILQSEGRTCEGGSGGTKMHPAVTMQRTAWKAIRDFAALFGLDPSSRTRLAVPPKDDGADAIDAFLWEG